MLKPMGELLVAARRQGYAVPAFDVADLSFVRAVVEEAEKSCSPAILMVLAQDAGDAMPLLAALVREAAGKASVPLALHLDHGRSLEECRQAVAEGFTGVMIDGAELPFGENVELTRKIVHLARPRNVGVEAEIGHMAEGVEGAPTDPEEAARFVSETEVDALTVSVGTAHGVYRREPKLDLGRLSEIARRCNCPLVLHGGSGTPGDQLQKAIALGVAKINFYTEVAQACIRGYRELADEAVEGVPLPGELCARPLERMTEVIRQKMAVCGSAGKA